MIPKPYCQHCLKYLGYIGKGSRCKHRRKCREENGDSKRGMRRF